MMLTTTLKELEKWGACQNGLSQLKFSLYRDNDSTEYSMEAPIKLTYIVESNDIFEAVWALRTQPLGVTVLFAEELGYLLLNEFVAVLNTRGGNELSDLVHELYKVKALSMQEYLARLQEIINPILNSTELGGANPNYTLMDIKRYARRCNNAYTKLIHIATHPDPILGLSRRELDAKLTYVLADMIDLFPKRQDHSPFEEARKAYAKIVTQSITSLKRQYVVKYTKPVMNQSSKETGSTQ